MKKLVCVLVSALVLFTLLAGCAQEQPEPPDNTVGNIFTQATEATQSVDSTVSSSWTVGAEMMAFDFDDIGPYLTYNGGEMKISIELRLSGIYATEGMGLLMFVNGEVQPYRMEDSEEYRMYYTLTAEENSDALFTKYDLYFVPAAGKAGEMASLYLILLADPDYRYCETAETASRISMSLTNPSHDCFAMYRIKMNADGTKTDAVYNADCVLSLETRYEGTPYKDIAGWTDEDLRSRVEYRLTLNNESASGSNFPFEHYGVPADQPLELSLELWGRPEVEYAIIPYINNEPIYLNDGNYLKAEIRSGEKAVIDLSLDISDTDGETHVFVYMIPLNVLETEETGPWQAMRSTYSFFVFTQEAAEVKAGLG